MQTFTSQSIFDSKSRNIVFYFRQTDLSGLRSVAFCLWTVSLSLSPAEGHFVVETRLAMIHVCTSNENAYQERRVSYLGGIFDGLKEDLEPTRKNRGMRKTQ